jgi:DNA polymerase-1
MLNRLVIFDGNHLAYRAYYKFMNLKTLDGVRTGVIYGMPYVAESLIRRLGPDEVVVVFDGGRSKFRNELLPSYKQRDKKLGFDAEDFHRQKDVGKELFKTLGLRIARQKHMEADDIITMISRRYSKKIWDVVIVSGDKDFNQLLKPYKDGVQGEISIYNTSKGQLVTYGNLKKFVDYTPDMCVDYLALTGDKSDNIDGYPGLGPVRTLRLLDKFGSVDNFLKSEEKFGKVDKSRLEEIWKRNKKLIDLKYFYRKFLMKEAIPWENPNFGFDEKELKKLCGTYEINSFLKPQFINTFKTIGK